MAKFSVSQQVDSPVETVFNIASDFPNAPDHIPDILRIEMLTEGPVGIGTRFKETRIMFGREATEEMEVIAFEPNKLYTLAADSCGARFESTLYFRPNSSGTEIEMETRTQAVSLFAKLMSPLGFLMAGTMKKCLQKDLQGVKSAAETKLGAAASQ